MPHAPIKLDKKCEPTEKREKKMFPSESKMYQPAALPPEKKSKDAATGLQTSTRCQTRLGRRVKKRKTRLLNGVVPASARRKHPRTPNPAARTRQKPTRERAQNESEPPSEERHLLGLTNHSLPARKWWNILYYICANPFSDPNRNSYFLG